MSTQVGSEVGQMAPEIDLPDGNGQRWRLSESRGKTVVLLFYPGDETPVCTKQMCSVRENWPRYQAAGAEVLGVNNETVESHRAFAAHHELPFRLLADPEGSVVKAYHMRMPIIGKTQRGVVVIDKDGIIRYRKVVLPMFRPGDDEVLEAVRRSQAPTALR